MAPIILTLTIFGRALSPNARVDLFGLYAGRLSGTRDDAILFAQYRDHGN